MNIEKMELWRIRIAEQKESGQRVYEWCTNNNLSKHAYYYWFKKISDYDLKHESETIQELFAEIPLNEPEPDSVKDDYTNGLSVTG